MTDTPPQLPPKIRKEIVARHAGPSRPLWREPLFWMAGALVATAMIVGFLWVRGTLHDATKACVKGDTRGPCIAAAQNAAGIASANARLTEHNLPPVPTPSSVPAVPTQTVFVPVPGAAGTNGVGGSAGPSGLRGPAGAIGPQGLPGVRGANGVSITGPAGANGANGVNGADGTNGAGGPAGPQGDPGPAGPQGSPGADGKSGSDGQPPLSWTYTDALGQVHTCTRDAGFDPSAPTYTCD